MPAWCLAKPLRWRSYNTNKFTAFAVDKELWELPEKHEDACAESVKIDVSIVLGIGIESNVAKDLHSDDGVDEKEHGDQ